MYKEIGSFSSKMLLTDSGHLGERLKANLLSRCIMGTCERREIQCSIHGKCKQ